MSSLILVTGASGHFGHETVHHLLDTLKVPANRIVAGSRHVDKLDELKTKGVHVRKLDFDDASSITEAAKGVERVVLISTHAMDGSDRRSRQAISAIKGFTAAGVKHVVYTSFVGTALKTPLSIANDHVATEKALADSTLSGYTILQNPLYFENTLGVLPFVAKSGMYPSASGQGKHAHMARSDLARAAASIVAGKESGKKTVVLAGPQLQTVEDMAATIGKVVGKPIKVVHISDEEQVANLLKAGVPEKVARIVESFETYQREGFLNKTSDEFKKITGVEPQKFEDWLIAHKHQFMPK